MAVAVAGSRGGWDAVTKWSLPDSAAHNADTAWQKLQIKRDVAKVETPGHFHPFRLSIIIMHWDATD
jgi:hypothetical protein